MHRHALFGYYYVVPSYNTRGKTSLASLLVLSLEKKEPKKVTYLLGKGKTKNKLFFFSVSQTEKRKEKDAQGFSVYPSLVVTTFLSVERKVSKRNTLI